MKILLIRPEPPQYTIGLKNIMVCEPLELEYVAAGLEGHEVEIMDMIFESDLTGKLRSFNPDVVGTSSYITGIRNALKICQVTKQLNDKILTLVGGVHASLVPEDFEDPFVDLVVCGEGIFQMQRIMERFANGSTYEGIPGVLVSGKRDDANESREYLSVHARELPFPRRDLVSRHSQKYYYLFHQPVSLVKTVFGCPFKCSFCYCWKLTDGKVFLRPEESVAQELKQIPTKEVYFIDDTFLVSPNRVMKLHDLIKDFQKNYLIYGHTDFIIKHPDLIRDWAKIGLKACIVGLESPRDDELDNYHKQTTVEKNNRAISILRKNKVDVYASFIVDPTWGKKDFALLKEYIREQKLYYVVIQPLTPLPGTDLFETYRDKLVIPREMHELWDMQHVLMEPDLPLKNYYSEIRKIYLSTFFNIGRTRNLQLRTVPSVWSPDYWRLLSGCLKIYMDLRNAHTHPAKLAKQLNS
ncbi:MAG: radical SAM protein [Bacteroidota bacterium]